MAMPWPWPWPWPWPPHSSRLPPELQGPPGKAKHPHLHPENYQEAFIIYGMKSYDLYEFSVEEMLFPEGKIMELYTEGRVRTPESFTAEIGRNRPISAKAKNEII